ncbi:MAG: nickel transporter [Burkholderiales bacterium]|nr:nickel transporter [Burkholderiales bacterium]
MESALLQNWLALTTIAFLLGAKHGLDPDHLAAIDSLTRFNAAERLRLARWCGCLFSLGHGLVVTLVSGVAAAVTTEWVAPAWLESAGAAISIAFLAALGLANLAAALRSRDGLALSTGLKVRWLVRLARPNRPVVIAAIGAAFAISFETWSQAALFSMTATHLSGWGFAVVLGLVFMAGMMAIDALNGWWVARLVRRAERRAVLASRVMSGAIGVLSLAIAALGAAKFLLPESVAPREGFGLASGVVVLVLLFVAYLFAMRIGRPAGAAR